MSHNQIIFINSHPIQYFAPLFRYMNEQGMPTACWYCSDENVKGHNDREFQSAVEWDIPILEGYPYRFFRNRSWNPSLYNGFFGLFNPSLLAALFREKKSLVIVHGWSYLTHVLVIIIARFAGHIVCLRGESAFNQERLKSKLNRLFKKLMLQGFIFRFIHRFLYIGTQNRLFYKHYGVSDAKLVFAPYAVDNARFREAAERLIPSKAELRKELGLTVHARIILFSAKYIEKKRPMELLAAFTKVGMKNKCLVMVGNGELRKKMEDFILDHNLTNVHLTGFVNQTQIVKYYALADVFVLCSGEGETWGLSVNEAMNFDLPLVVSDMAGCASDLVEEGRNGVVTPLGDTTKLARGIERAIALDGKYSRELIDRFSFRTISESLRQLINGQLKSN